MSRWPMVSLGNHLSQRSADVVVDPVARYRTTGVLSHGKGFFWRPEISGAETSYTKFTQLRTSDFVFSKLFGWEGALGVISEAFDGGLVSSEFPVFDVDTAALDPAYLGYAVRRPDFYQGLATSGMGNRRQRVNPRTVLNSQIPLPSLDEQCRIAAWLRTIERVAGAALRKAEVTGALSSGLIESVVQRSSDQARSRLGDLLVPVRQQIDVDPQRHYRQIGIKSFGKGMIRYSSATGLELSKLRYFKFPENALAVSNIQAWEGALCLTETGDDDRVASNRFHFYLPRPGVTIDIAYVLAYLLSEEGWLDVREASPGSTMRNKTLSISRFENIMIPVPSPVVQGAISQSRSLTNRLGSTVAWRRHLIAKTFTAALNQVFGS